MTNEPVPRRSSDAQVDVYAARRASIAGKLGRVERRNRFLGLLLVLSLAKDPILAWGLAKLAARPGAVPWFVPVDRLGNVGSPVRATDVPPPGPEIVERKIRKCVADLRLVYVDPVALGDRQREGRSCLRGDALAYVDRYFALETNNPFLLAADRYRRVDVTRVLQIKDGTAGSSSWKVEWRETDVPRDGASVATLRAWAAVVTIAIIPAKTDEEVEANASGAYITGIDWRADSAPQAIPTTPASSEAAK